VSFLDLVNGQISNYDGTAEVSVDFQNRYSYDTDGNTIVAKWGNGDGTLRDGSDNIYVTTAHLSSYNFTFYENSTDIIFGAP
jgi:hypothetical protein